MSEEIIRIKSITQLHDMLGCEKPLHPLVTVMDVSKLKPTQHYGGVKVSSEFYSIFLKDSDCGMLYGRNYYDFEEGVLSFIAPNQVISSNTENFSAKGWMLFFHPDLIRGFNLAERMDEYTFFSYDVHEALHLSEREEQILNDCVSKIESEYNQNIDSHSQALIVSNIELLLNYSKRFYERQFHTRKTQNSDTATKIEKLLKIYFNSDLIIDEGLPTVQYFADQVHLSPNYLSDLLKKETGRSAKDHINDYLIEKAKNKLLNTNNSISDIAYSFGFNYPHYFSRLFKNKTGYTPQGYRDIN